MSAITKENITQSIFDEIQSLPAWKGCISGLVAEKMLRGKKTPYLYLVRAGEFVKEHEADYYVTFVHADLSVRHQPVVVTNTSEGWMYENSGPGGIYNGVLFTDVVHLMMHCSKDDPVPFTRFAEHA